MRNVSPLLSSPPVLHKNYFINCAIEVDVKLLNSTWSVLGQAGNPIISQWAAQPDRQDNKQERSRRRIVKNEKVQFLWF